MMRMRIEISAISFSSLQIQVNMDFNLGNSLVYHKVSDRSLKQVYRQVEKRIYEIEELKQTDQL